jgi:hypothetical protein
MCHADTSAWMLLYLNITTATNTSIILARSALVAENDSQRRAINVAERKELSLLRDEIFGPSPDSPVPIAPAWLRWNCQTIPAIARRIYEERAFHDMPILGDALEDAGCTDATILDHCRSERPHYLGCWVVDAILGK